MTQTTEAVLAQIDDAIEDWQVGPDAMRCNAPAGVGLASMPTPRVDLASITRISVDLTVAMQKFARGMAEVANAVAKMVEENPALRRLLGLHRPHDEHHPPPLCIDGAAYARRQKSRRGRR